MSRRRNAPYADRIEDEGRTLIYEGHDARKNDVRDPRPLTNHGVRPSGSLTQNGRFEQAALAVTHGAPEYVRVYEKLHDGVWAYNGPFALTGVTTDFDGVRNVFKFRLELADSDDAPAERSNAAIVHARVIPSTVKLEVWRRDAGRCVKCGAADNLHFDHVLPFSRGGASITAANVQILCARHNLEKRARIE